MSQPPPLNPDLPPANTGLPPVLPVDPPPLPATDPVVVEPTPRKIPKWRWWLHLLILGPFPLVLGLIGWSRSGEIAQGTMLPDTVADLLLISATEMAIFGVIFGGAWLSSRASVDELRLRWRGGFRPILWGALHSIGLRVGVALVILVIVLAAGGLSGNKDVVEKIRPQTENIVPKDALVNDTLYLVLTMTLISFVVAGFREEMWRAGTLAAIEALFPKFTLGWKGKLAAVVFIAIIFGLGHLPQGGGGVLVTALLGIGLGAIMIWHRSVWEAVLAHGFFNASTFLLLHIMLKYFPGQIPGF